MSLIDLDYYENKDDKLSEISDLLKELPLYKFYENINKELDNNVATGKCNECNTMLSGIDKDAPKLLQMCKNFCNIISKASDLNLHCKDSSYNTSFIQMNLLLYSNVISITKESHIIEKFYKALESISKIPISEKKLCGIKNFYTIHDNFKNLKYLYEFLFTYNDIDKKISLQNNKTIQLYCNHIKENFRLYNEIKETCPKSGYCLYSNELGKIQNIFKDPIYLSKIYSKCNYAPTPCKKGSNEANYVPCLKEKESTFTTPIKNSDSDNVTKNIIDGLTYSIPTLATLTMLYKFTPLGSWLYSKIKRTNNMEKNINAENYYISHHNTRIEEIDPGNGSNNTY